MLTQLDCTKIRTDNCTFFELNLRPLYKVFAHLELRKLIMKFFTVQETLLIYWNKLPTYIANYIGTRDRTRNFLVKIIALQYLLRAPESESYCSS